MEATLGKEAPEYSFNIICSLLFIFELCYLSEIGNLKR